MIVQKTRKIYLNLRQLQAHFISVFVFVFLFAFAASAATVYPPSTSFTLGEFLYDDDYVATTTDCTMKIWDPSGALVVNQTMIDEANGWHYYNFAGSATQGTWPAEMSCGTAGVDLVKGDKTFIIATSTGSTSEVADAVATLVNANTNSVVENASSSLSSMIPLSVWNVASSTVFTVGSMGSHLVSTLTGSVSNIAYSVWNYTSRLLTGKTLTDGGQLATETYVDTATSTLNTNINTTIENASSSITTLVNANTNSAIATASSSLAATIPLSVWNVASSTVFTVGSMGSHLVSTLTGSVSNIAYSVWNYTSRLLTGKTLTDGGQLATETYVDTATSTLNTNINNTISNASSSITTLVNANTNSAIATASSSLAATIPLSVWNVASSTVFTVGSMGSHLVANLNNTISSIASAVWSTPNRRLSDKILADGTSLATENYLDIATSTIIAQVDQNETLLNNLNDISAADVWAYGTKNVTLSDPKQVWDVASSTLTAAGSIGKQIAENLDMAVSAGGSLTAADVWSHATRTLTETATSSIALAVWGEGTRTLTNYGNDITAADVWNVLSSTLTAENSIGKQVATNLVASTTIATAVWDNPVRSLTTFGSLSTDVATAVWANGTRSLTSFGTLIADIWSNPTRRLSDKTLTDGGQLATESYVDTATSTLNNNINSTINNASSSITTLVNANTNSVVENASSSLASAIETRATLSSQQAGWVVTMSDFGETTTGQAYHVRLTTLNYESVPTDSASLPIITITDSAGSEKLAVNTPMIRDSAGVYHYNYTVPSDAVGGTWETQVATEVESGKVISTNDYWRISSSPADVLILSMADRIIPVVTASVQLMNKGTAGSDFYYVYCVVDSEDNQCGGNDDTDYKSMTEYINPGETLNRSLSLDVPTAGTYWFKLKARALNEVNWAASAEQFIAESGVVGPSCGDGSCNGGETCNICSTDCGQCNNGGGGGGGGGTPPPVNPPPPDDGVVHIADLNKDGRVNSIDFSILLYFWRTASPFSNPYVDINKDVKVDSVDFSILLYYYGEIYD